MKFLCLQGKNNLLDNWMAVELYRHCFNWPWVSILPHAIGRIIIFLILVLSSKFMTSDLLFGIEWWHALKIFSFFCRVNENTKLSTILENHLQPSPWKNQLQKFCEQLDSLKFFVCTYPKVNSTPLGCFKYFLLMS